MHGLSAVAERLNIQNCINSMGNFVHYIDGFSVFTEKMNSTDTLNAQNCVNSTGLDMHEISVSRIA